MAHQAGGPAVPPLCLADVMSFGGAGPETINGRLAMLGFVAALFAELSSGEWGCTLDDKVLCRVAPEFTQDDCVNRMTFQDDLFNLCWNEDRYYS